LPLRLLWLSAAGLRLRRRVPRRQPWRRRRDMMRDCRSNARRRHSTNRSCAIPDRFPGATWSGPTTALI